MIREKRIVSEKVIFFRKNVEKRYLVIHSDITKISLKLYK